MRPSSASRLSGPTLLALAALGLVLVLGHSLAEAANGCPFDDSSCQDYCGKQGCKVGYCGHFAWSRCICRKCGQEWNLYDTVHYNPDAKVNQTELDSLKLTGTAPSVEAARPRQDTPSGEPGEAGSPQPPVSKLTTLLIPDLSESHKLSDLNDIPDENSEKFLDYLAKNHERLAQATRTADSDQEEPEEGAPESSTNAPDDDTVEIQISTSDNQPTTTTAPAPTPASAGVTSTPASPTRRLLKLAPVDSEDVV